MSKCGFVSVIGRTNAGKSSIINALLGQNLTFVSKKQNATRRKINAIVMSGDNQIIFTDTPGLHKSQKSFNQHLIKTALKSTDDCDLILFVVSVLDEVDEYLKFLKSNPNKPHILMVNKIDLISNEKLLSVLEKYNQFNDKFIALFPFSAKQKSCVEYTLEQICRFLPEHDYFYDPEQISDSNLRQIAADLILESVFDNLSDEVPYCCDVIINDFVQNEFSVKISAKIITDTNSHKAMLIGKDGNTIKRLGITARKRLCEFLETKVDLKLFVQVEKNWQKSDEILKELKIYCD